MDIKNFIKIVKSFFLRFFDNNFKVLIYGLPKSGTTILTYRIAEALGPSTQIIFEPQERKYNDEKSEIILTKCLYGPVIDFNYIRKNYCDYNKKIWLARDPRDVLVSSYLYKWYKGHNPNEDYFKQALKKVKLKEENPTSIPFYQLETVDIKKNNISFDEIKNKHKKRYQPISDFIKNLKNDWLIYKYEELIQNNYSPINEFLKIKINDSVEVPTKVSRVVRSKSHDNWRDWFTPEDVEFYRPLFEDYMKLLGYNVEDWKLNEKSQLSPELGSEYMVKLFI